MKINVVGCDPSMNNWGFVKATLDLSTGYLESPVSFLVHPPKTQGKTVRINSKDLEISKNISNSFLPCVKDAHALFVEIPVGSQKSRAAVSYGMCIGILGSVQSLGVPIIEVTAAESKLLLTGNKTATKSEMIKAAVEMFPEVNWPTHGNRITAKAEHIADALAAIYAGVRTPAFQTMMRIFAKEEK